MHETETILVVDDDQHLRTILKHVLEQGGFQVELAQDGPQALACLQRELPDLVLLDVMMPGLDGFDVLRELRARFRTHHLPVIMLTAKGETPHRVRGLAQGANDYLSKPFVPDELVLRVRNLLQLSRSQRDANPLTGLPGNRAIARELNRRLEAGQSFGFLYLDLDHFKAFNDHYGYVKGDAVLTMLADLLATDVLACEDAFLGHVGGDDFIAVTRPQDADGLAERIVAEFDERILAQYEPEDRRRGYIELPDRTGRLRRFPPVSLTVAVVVEQQGGLGHVGRLNAVAAELKKYGKSLPGSQIIHERRFPVDAVAAQTSPPLDARDEGDAPPARRPGQP
ncbi:MAG: response regulator [bacterium]|nr:response regulator [bacterium]